MKHLLLAACLLTLIVSCKKEESDDMMDKGLLAYAEVPKESHKEFYGLWTGVSESDYSDADVTEKEELVDEFYFSDDRPNKITIKINRIIKDSVFGYSIIGGNQRALKGTLTNAGNLFSFTLNEPGKHKNDGKYKLFISNDTLQGNWAIYTPNKEITPKKTMKLVQKKFEYDPNEMLNKNYRVFFEWDSPVEKEFSYKDENGNEQKYKDEAYRISSRDFFTINPSADALTEQTLKNLRKLDLEILRNSIYARHGYAFKKKSFRYFFESNEWYVPVSENADKELTALEKKNIALLKRMEQYATDHYDTFGR